ncbi:DUF1176 domain-containing protein [Klebsiella pneumoniae subsp. pneumoniae]|nr:DUF1176 domain-containing protein [Klebsiella pneumoniae subsp. pneumoniae]
MSKPAAAHYRGLSYADGAIVFSHKERGMADCVTGETRVWDGKNLYPQPEVQHRYVSGKSPGGTWMLPTFVSRLIPQAGRKRRITLALRTLYNTVLKAQKKRSRIVAE